MKVILVGGFLGSGKTTGVVTACQLLRAENRTFAVITNDQGDQQVDRAYVESLGIESREVSNGCFCCNYNELDQHLKQLTKATRPEFIFAEAVGSCTDMLATVVRPLRKFNPGISTQLCVFLDAELLSAIIENKASFISESVRYIYKKQIEEAEVLLVNKIDRITQSQQSMLRDILLGEYPASQVLFQNSLEEISSMPWLNVVKDGGRPSDGRILDIDYEVYGKGEAELAWVNKSLNLTTYDNDAPRVVRALIGRIFDQLQEQRLVIGHLKFFLDSPSGSQKISFTTTSTSSSVTVSLPDTDRIQLMINARVQTSPASLLAIINAAIEWASPRFNCSIEDGNTASFAPGFPKPTHRIV
jgi:Ni2+-binding GTPase involved in maturation of urease and hydrogenase